MNIRQTQPANLDGPLGEIPGSAVALVQATNGQMTLTETAAPCFRYDSLVRRLWHYPPFQGKHFFGSGREIRAGCLELKKNAYLNALLRCFFRFLVHCRLHLVIHFLSRM